MYIIGIDGGGTNSRLIGVDKSLNVLGSSNGGATNITSNSHSTVKNNLKELIDKFNSKTNTKIEDCEAFCIGSAGVDTEETQNLMLGLIKQIGIKGKIKVVNDAELILASETKGEKGICVISGTGSIASAVDENGNNYRTGGWGYLIDDGGSGYRIGMDAIKAVLMEHDGRGKKTALTDVLKTHFAIDDMAKLIDIVYTSALNKSEIASLSKLVKSAASQNDEVAMKIEYDAAFALFEHVNALVNSANLSSGCKIVLSGGVITLNNNIRKIFTELVLEKYSNMEVVVTSEKPEMGAVYLAIKA